MRTCHMLLLLCSVTLLSCGFATDPSPASAAPREPGTSLKIVCTTGMVADLVRSIAGERATVTGLMGEGVDPHLYKASPGDLRLLSTADMVFYNGLHLEGKMSDALERLGARKPVVAVAAALPEAKLLSPPEFSGQHDPHVWFDVSLWAKTIPIVRDALIKHDPTSRDLYEVRAAAYEAQLAELHTLVGETLAQIPRESRILVTAHDAFAYFGRAYDLEVMAIQGISTDSEPSLRDINALVETLVNRKIKAVFVESSVAPKTIESLIEGCESRGHVVTIGGELYSDALGAPGTPEGTYVGMVKHNLTVIAKALMGEAAWNNRAVPAAAAPAHESKPEASHEERP